jgi:hypothetical protein
MGSISRSASVRLAETVEASTGEATVVEHDLGRDHFAPSVFAWKFGKGCRV